MSQEFRINGERINGLYPRYTQINHEIRDYYVGCMGYRVLEIVNKWIIPTYKLDKLGL